MPNIRLPDRDRNLSMLPVLTAVFVLLIPFLVRAARDNNRSREFAQAAQTEGASKAQEQTEVMYARVKVDMRMLATAIEAFGVDWHLRPNSTRDVKLTVDAALAQKNPNSNWKLPTFQLVGEAGGQTAALTTPVAYITQILPDPFGIPPGRSYLYTTYSRAPGEEVGHWLVWSAGPDGRYDIDGMEFNPSNPNDLSKLILRTYDPTNGTSSAGDIWRLSEPWRMSTR